MNEVDLKKRAEELEQTLQLQLAQLKKDSETWLKVGGAAVALALLVSAVAKNSKRKKDERSQRLAEVLHEPVHRIQKKAKASSFFPPFKKRLFMALLSLGQTKLMEELKRRQGSSHEG
jgi:hypothetical protein